MEIKILGSVSPYCRGDKNCVGYLVKSNNSKILLDCGNGISRNMDIKNDLNNLTIIISHLHKDHYGELLSLSYASYINHKLGYLNDKVKVYLPKTDMIEPENIWGDPIVDKINLPDLEFLNNFGNEHYMDFIMYDSHTKLNIDDLEISFRLNPHQINTYSTKIQENDKVFVYSADTGFKNNSLSNFALNADILLCESTYLIGQVKSSDDHLYAYEAALIAKKANVDKLILTHFYPELDRNLYKEEAEKIFSNTDVARENKVLKLGGKHE